MANSLMDMLADAVFKAIFNAEWIGKRGETLTVRQLKMVNLSGRKGKILRNLYVPKENGETSEIDVIYICQKGIFVLESKNYSGWVFGDEKSSYWTVLLVNKEKNKLYNPIRQNKTHIKWLKEYLKNSEIPLFSVVVFSERCELKKVDSPVVPVVKRDRLFATVRGIWDASPDVLQEEQVNALYEQLKKLTNADEATKEAHIKQIEEKFTEKNAPQTVESEQVNQAEPLPEEEKAEEKVEPKELLMLCPRCGGALVLRTVKKGENAGQQFYGCSNFPKCRYTKKIEGQTNE